MDFVLQFYCIITVHNYIITLCISDFFYLVNVFFPEMSLRRQIPRDKMVEIDS